MQFTTATHFFLPAQSCYTQTECLMSLLYAVYISLNKKRNFYAMQKIYWNNEFSIVIIGRSRFRLSEKSIRE